MKTFTISTIVGAIAGILGWAGAELLQAGAGADVLASIPWGSTGLVIGAVALLALLFAVALHDIADPILVLLGAAIGTTVMWGRPIDTIGVSPNGASSTYWVALAVLTGTFFLLLFGLRGARISTQNYRPW